MTATGLAIDLELRERAPVAPRPLKTRAELGARAAMTLVRYRRGC